MAMVCPQCHSAFDQRLHCPQCDVRLVYQDQGRSGRRSFGAWQQTAWGRIIIGLLLAQGLYYGLRHLCVAGLLATNFADAEALGASVTGLLLLQGLQIVSLFIGGIFAGAGQKSGAIYGAVLGVWNGVFLVLLQPEQTPTLGTLSLYGQPLLQACLGLLAGWLGSQIWKPLVIATEAEPLRKAKAGPRTRTRLFAGRIAGMRVVTGTVLAVAGSLGAANILELIITVSDNRLTPGSQFQAQLVTWEIGALAIFIGSTLAGATTANGFKQGLAVGVATAVVLFGIRLGGSSAPLEGLLLGTASPIILGIGGGGFGGQLFPPLTSSVRLKSFQAP